MVVQKIIAFDEYIAGLIGENIVLNWLALAISVSVILLIVVALYYWWVIKKDKQVILKLAVGTITLSVITELIKILTARPRPNLEDFMSFPSRHVALAAMLALFLPVKRKIKLLLFVWLIGVAASRILLGKHWLSDVIVGALIGAAAAFVLVKWKIKGK